MTATDSSPEPAPVTEEDAKRWKRLAEIAVSMVEDPSSIPDNAILRLLRDRARAKKRIGDMWRELEGLRYQLARVRALLGEEVPDGK